MNAVHPHTFHVVKAEEAHRLALIERRSMARAGNGETVQPVSPHTGPVQRRRSFRAAGAALATVALMLSILVGGALANEQSTGGGGGGGQTRVTLQ